jgi:peptidoglycan/xylan/chitin deacetylase (PgdA/CDA1 family)
LGGGPRITWSEVRVNGPFIAITFDDGPHPTLTPQLLDMLKQRGIHATFFVLGSLVKDHPEIVRRALAEGHEIANHSWDHPNLGKMSEEAVRSQINRTKEAINAATGGKASDLMRPPYGSLTSAQRRWMHDDLGYKIMLWSVDPFDWKRPGPEAITHRIVEGTHSGGIVLVHDIHPGSVAAMPATLDGLLAKGFKFVTVSELLAMELPPEPKKTAALTGAGVQPTPRRTLAPGVPEKITGTEPGAEPAPAPAAASPSPTPKRRR